MPTVFNNQEFKSQPALVAYIKERLLLEPLRQDLRGEVLGIVQELYSRVNDDEAPDRFRLVPHAGNRELQSWDGDRWIARSVKKAVAEERNSGPNLARAMRAAIEPQIRDFRDRAFAGGQQPVCELSGLPVTRSTVDVDHVTQFTDLKGDWLGTIGGPDAIVFVKVATGGYALTGEQLQSWQDWHESHAVLRLLGRQVHREHTNLRLAA